MASTTATKMTAEEFYEWANRPENEDKRFELEDGVPVEIPLSGERHGVVCWLAINALTEHILRRGDGHLLANNCGLLVGREPDTLRGPDIMVFRERLKPTKSDKYCEQIPALIVEVLSPTDRANRMNRRIGQYLARGVPIVWVVDPDDRTVGVHRLGMVPVEAAAETELTGFDVLPDLKLRVADFFTLPGQAPTPAP